MSRLLCSQMHLLFEFICWIISSNYSCSVPHPQAVCYECSTLEDAVIFIYWSYGSCNIPLFLEWMTPRMKWNFNIKILHSFSTGIHLKFLGKSQHAPLDYKLQAQSKNRRLIHSFSDHLKSHMYCQGDLNVLNLWAASVACKETTVIGDLILSVLFWN